VRCEHEDADGKPDCNKKPVYWAKAHWGDERGALLCRKHFNELDRIRPRMFAKVRKIDKKFVR